MALIVAIVLALIVLPWPWNLLVILGGLAVETGEIAWGLRLARRWKPKTGAEAMTGGKRRSSPRVVLSGRSGSVASCGRRAAKQG